MFFVFPYSRFRSSCCRGLVFFPSGPCMVERPFCRSLCRWGPIARRPCLVYYFCRCRGTEFACRWGVFVSLTGPVHVMSRFQLSVAIAVLFLSMWRDRSVSVRDFRRPYPSRRPDQIVFGGSWYHTNWAFDRQVRTLHAFLDSDLGADSRRLGGDIVES